MSTNNLASERYLKFGKPLAMKLPPPLQQIIGQNVARLRDKAGMSPQQLANKVGVALFTIQQIENGTTRKSRYLPDIARILEVPLSEIDPSQKAGVVELAPTIEDLYTGNRDLPLYATTDGGEGILVMSSVPVRHIARPASLEGVEGAYAVIVRGDSMGNLAPNGSIVLVDPYLPANRGDLCVFRVEQHGDFSSVIKEFVSGNSTHWRVKRYRPKEKEFNIKKSDWPECHVVVTVHRR